jgi:ADP-ribose pyrophosphatase
LPGKQSRIAWQGPAWHLRVETISLPDGHTLERGIIEHPGSVVLVPLREGTGKSEVIMLRQYRSALDETILELPAGTQGWQLTLPATTLFPL